jgi:hypothetical protein
MNSLPTWAMWSIIAAAILSPVLAFLMAIAVEIFIGVLKDAGILEFLAIGAISWAASQAAGPAARKCLSRNVSSALRPGQDNAAP